MTPPLATYRLQLGPHLSFDDAARLVPYLASLGISHCYTSPVFETSAPDSPHGYDVSDHARFREALGGEPGFVRLAEAVARHGVELLIDVVPNHMGIAGHRNEWWLDVLEFGPSAAHAPYFDIDWTPVKRELAGKVLLPILGDHYGAVLERGELRLEQHDGTFVIRYHENLLPVSPSSYGRILSHRIEELHDALGSDDPALVELKAVTTWFVTLPIRPESDREALAARRRHRDLGRQRLAALLESSSRVRAFIEENVRLLNGTPGDPQSFELLDALLGDQAYRVAFWRVSSEEINYRRFFDVDQLAAIRMERADVFAEAHVLVARLLREGIVTGLRIDHPDGLYAPAEYFRRLQELSGPVYVVAEKILAPGERWPAAWDVAGTTGYETLNLLNGIFVDRTQARALDQLYRRLTHEAATFAEIVYDSKRLIMETVMASEIAMLAHRLNIISERHRSTRDFTLGSLTRAVREIIAAFPIYRTYVGDAPVRDGLPLGSSDGPVIPTERDQEYITRAVTLAKRRAAATDVSVFDWIQDLLMRRFPAWADAEHRRERLDWVMRFQQTTGPVTAKGYEDTALYRYHRLISLNDVGGDPARFGTPLNEFHAAMAARQKECPDSLTATSTHDTKRSEDVRARINVLSEIPQEWRRRVSRWQRLNRRHRIIVDGTPAPGPNEEYLLYQTLVGAWPISAERLRQYALKAMHEAKLHTSWINPHPKYDEAVTAFVDAILESRRSREFLRDLAPFAARVAWFGTLNSLAQTLIKITAPGVPDFYQGSELWDLSLVDPDNRRPVDWALRERLLDGLATQSRLRLERGGLARDLVKWWEDGRVKLYVIREALAARRGHATLFQRGDYAPLEASGGLADHVCAFARVAPDDAAIVVVPRFLARRGVETPPLGPSYWEDTRVAMGAGLTGRFNNVFTGATVSVNDGELPVADALADFPVALLIRTA
ncbi:MAG: malto-oligosyltrehalose synthase [Candidatus Rokubacteria bacterium 13_1_40CM_68_15]|nr:MAG: malto-oligosyltrehalose synthase [Candidatus Rokubacteria bacterium 13_1_40CM_68_15]